MHPALAAMETARSSNLLAHGWQKELPVRPIEAGGKQVGALSGIEVDYRVGGNRHVALDLCGTEPRNEPCHGVDQSRLAAPRAPDDPHRPARINSEIDIAQNRPCFSAETYRETADPEPA